MKENKKTIELYLDSKTYNDKEVLETIEKTKLEFSNKEVEVKIHLNNWGVYIIKMDLKNKNTYINNIKSKIIKPKIKIKSKIKEKKPKKEKVEKSYEIKTYGKYKQTHEYKPY